MTSTTAAATDQHYVPKLLLRGFSPGKRKQLYAFDKQTERIFRSSIRNLACERGFYETEKPTDEQSIDDWLKLVESDATPTIDTMRRTGCLKWMTLQQRVVTAAFLIVQHLRTRAYQQRWADLDKQMTEALRAMGAEPNNVQNFKPLSATELRDFFIESIPGHARQFVPYLLDKSWILLRAVAPDYFIISDNPVTLANNLNPGDGVRGTLGLRVQGIEVYLPISTEYTLALLCPTIEALIETVDMRSERVGLDLPRNREFLAAFKTGTSLPLDTENVKYHNSLQVANAERYVFSPYNDFAMAMEMVNAHSELRIGPRVYMASPPRKPRPSGN